MEGCIMIIYRKLENILQQRGLQWKDLCNAGISINTPTKFKNNRSMNTDMIDKVCAFLNAQPGDIMEWVENENEAEIASIDAQIAELMQKKKELQTK